MDQSNKYGILKSGLAVDIDETLSWTIVAWAEKMQAKFGNPENLSAEEVARKYRYTQNVPYWQHPEAMQWTHEQIHSNSAYDELPLIEGAEVYLNKINEIVPVAAYITIRPETVAAGTIAWFKKYHFPPAPIIFKPASIALADGNKWKGEILNKLYPTIQGIIDDSAKVIKFLGPEYSGKVFLYDHDDNLGLNNVSACPDWPSVYEAVKRQYS